MLLFFDNDWHKNTLQWYNNKSHIYLENPKYCFLFFTMVHVGIQIHYNGMIRTIIIWKLKKKYYYVTEKNTYRLQQVSKIARLAIQVT